VEPWDRLVRDGKEIFVEHYEELSLEKGRIPLGMDFACYQDLEAKGYLHVLTCRKRGALIGYYNAIMIAHHPHYKDSGKMATCDMFYINKSERTGGAGAKLLIMAAKTLKERGVIKASMSIKLHQDYGELLEKLGWNPTDRVYHKIL
jgi:GNAT superfamily N-acetyltransferase